MKNKPIELRVLIIGLLCITLALLWWIYNSTRENVIHDESKRINNELTTKENILTSTLRSGSSKLRFLYSTPALKGVVRSVGNNGVDPSTGFKYEAWRNILSDLFLSFVETNPSILQARLIGVKDDGRELVRVDRDFNSVFIVNEDDLQKKGDRDYFNEITAVPRRGLYISNLNLNRDFGKITYPYQPTYRIGMPVYSDQGLFGVLVLNFDAKPLLDRLKANVANELRVFFTNSNGGFLIHPDKVKEFNFEFEASSTWDNQFTSLPKTNNSDGLDTYINKTSNLRYYMGVREVFLPGQTSQRLLKILVGISDEDINQLVMERSSRLVIPTLASISILILFLMLYQRNLSKSFELNAAQARYEAIIEGLSDAFVSMDSKGRVIGWNSTAREMFGFRLQELKNKPLTDSLVSEHDIEAVDSAIQTVQTGQSIEPISISAKQRNNRSISVSLALSPIRSSKNKINGIAAIMRDISSQIAAELRILEMNANLESEIKERTRELENARNEALSASETKSNFIANVSHEIRTPLNGIIGMLHLLRKNKDPQSQKRFLEIAENSSKALAALINDVLDLSKIESGKLEIDRQNYDLLEVLGETLDSIALSVYHKKLELVTDFSGIRHRKIIGDPMRFRQIITNLVSNALKFTESGWIKVSGETRIDHDDLIELRFTVQDTGVGIARENLKDIFNAFQQEDNSVTRKFGGTGLGLSIVRELCRLMDGDITVVSDKGAGACFEFKLHQQLDEADATPIPFIELSNYAILIVSENFEFADAIKHQLDVWRAKQIRISERIQDLEGSDLSIFDFIFVDFDEDTIVNRLKALDANIILMYHGSSIDSEIAGPHVFTLRKPVTIKRLFRSVDFFLSGPGKQIQVERPGQTNTPVFEERVEQANLDMANVTILVVDDNDVNQQVVVGLLESFSPTIHVAANGLDAIGLLKKLSDPVDIILMDCQMPQMDGYECTRRIRSGDAGPQHRLIPIIAMTASAMAGDREKCLEAGMNDYLTKPVDPQTLEKTLCKTLSLNYVVSEDKEDDEEQRQVEKDGTPPDLILDSNPGEEKSESESLETLLVWDKAALLNRVKNKVDLFEKLADMYCDGLATDMQQLQLAVADNDYEKVRALAHKIKGASGSVGAMRLHALCQKLEHAGLNKEQQEIKTRFSQLSEQVKVFMTRRSEEHA